MKTSADLHCSQKNSATIDENGIHDFKLADTLNLYFRIGCTTFTRHELLAYGGMHWARVENCLRAWESRGLIEILKPLTGTEDAEIVIRLLHPIEASEPLREIPFLAPLAKKIHDFTSKN